LWNYLSKKNIDEIVTGAVQPKINQGNLKSLSFPQYPKSLVLEFNEITKPLFDKIQHNNVHVGQLEKMRSIVAEIDEWRGESRC
jgi:type I restriction enzyme S subunit